MCLEPLREKVRKMRNPTAWTLQGAWVMGGAQVEQRQWWPWSTCHPLGSQKPDVLKVNNNNNNNRKWILGNMPEQEKGETADIWLFKAKQWLAAIQPNPRGLYTVQTSIKITEILLRRQIMSLEATSQEEAECGQDLGGNEGELGEMAPWLHNSKYRKLRMIPRKNVSPIKWNLQLNMPHVGKIRRIYKENQSNWKDEHPKHRPVKRKLCRCSSHKLLHKF